jgi:hemerythrin-like domain-containing protein
MTIITTSITDNDTTAISRNDTDRTRRVGYGTLTSWVLGAAFTLSAAHTVYSEVVDLADPGFRIGSPVVWVFYTVGFGAALTAKRAGRAGQIGLLAYLVALLGIGMLYYPTTFTDERQTVFGWIENDVYLGLLMLAAAFTALRLCRVELVGDGTRTARTASANAETSAATDVHDMVVVHRAFRRELALVPAVVRDVPAGDTSRAELVGAHVRLCLDGLHLHHTSEDDLLWPLLLDRAGRANDVVDRMQGQHLAVDELLEQIEPVLARWEAEARPAVGVELAAILDGLRATVLIHLDEEERSILPLAARWLSQDEWNAIGQAGVAKMSRRQLPLMFGMVMEDATPYERRKMLGVVPMAVRLVLRTWGAHHYARYVTSIRGA